MRVFNFYSSARSCTDTTPRALLHRHNPRALLHRRNPRALLHRRHHRAHYTARRLAFIERCTAQSDRRTPFPTTITWATLFSSPPRTAYVSIHGCPPTSLVRRCSLLTRSTATVLTSLRSSDSFCVCSLSLFNRVPRPSLTISR